LAEATIAISSGSPRATAYLPGVCFSGSIVHVASNLVSLTTASGVEVNIQVGSTTVIRFDRNPGRRNLVATGGPQTFIARMRQIELDQYRVRVIAVAGPQIVGVLAAVSKDHIMIGTSDDTWVVSYPSIAAVVVGSDQGSDATI